MSGGLDEGTRLGPEGRYVLESRLGSGGAATVWLAEDTVLERPVAVKVLSEALSSDQNWLARFRREARLAASLQHPNLVSVYDFSAEEVRPYIVMAHLPGGSLYDHLQDGERPEPERLVRDLLAALAAIHATGIIHRDLKPGNVLLAADGTACLTDFGVARPEDATSLTQTGHIPGTARYMAPELWKGHEADERSDLYAMGVLLRAAVGDDAPAWIRDLIESLAADDPDDRPVSAAAALSMLEPEERTPVAPSPAPAWREEAAPRTIEIHSDSQPNRRAALAGLAVLAVIAVVAIALATGGGGDSEGSGSSNRDNSGQGASENSNGGASGQGAEEPAPEPETPAPEEPPESGDGIALNQQGKELLDAGDPEAAVPVLQQAVDSYPEGSRDINYAFALFNLGDALVQAGRPEEAIPLLEERLTFDDQTATVQAKLDEARAATGQDTSGEDD